MFAVSTTAAGTSYQCAALAALIDERACLQISDQSAQKLKCRARAPHRFVLGVHLQGKTLLASLPRAIPP